MSERTKVEPAVADVALKIADMLTPPRDPGLGIDWRVMVEVRGRRVAEITRTRDEGIAMRFVDASTPGGQHG